MLNRNLNEEFEIFKRNAADKSISCEIVAGHVVQSVMTGEDGHKLCFLLGTILEDYLMIRKKPDQVLFGPVDFRLNESNIFQPDLAVVEQSEVYRNGVIRASGAEQIPKLLWKYCQTAMKSMIVWIRRLCMAKAVSKNIG